MFTILQKIHFLKPPPPSNNVVKHDDQFDLPIWSNAISIPASGFLSEGFH